MKEKNINKVYNWINGQECPSQSNSYFEKISPSTGSKIFDVVKSSFVDVNSAAEAAKNAFCNWANKTPVQRGNYLFSITEILQKKRQDLANIVSLETGKSIKDALSEVQAAIDQGRFMASEGFRMNQRVIPSAIDNKTVLVVREPIGVAALLVSFNTPIANITWKVFPALICGNTVILKSSEHTPATTNFFAKITEEAKLPQGVLNVVHGDGVTGELLIKNHFVELISFTGSTNVGRKIQTTAATRNVRTFLELGGKNPMVICDDADIELSLKWALLSSFSNAGQRCASSSRIIIFDSIYDKFKNEFISKVNKLKVGSEDEDDLGPVVSLKQLRFLEEVVLAATKEGGNLLTGGKRVGDKGNYFAPTVIENILSSSKLSKMELFGPITFLYRASSFQNALDIANDSPYGLTSSIHTKNIHRALEFSKKMKCGVVTINGGTHGSEAHMPFGGIKDSGNGQKEPGMEALEVYSITKNICINHLPSSV
ncbi:MAG: aldehyde dehydrogenase [Oligoflexia bacterium]|nr:aldehyde dehydrogenase [Oligoflexia bacterium]